MFCIISSYQEVSLKLVYEPIVATHNFLAELLVILAVSLVLVYISSCVGRILRRNRLLGIVLFGDISRNYSRHER